MDSCSKVDGPGAGAGYWAMKEVDFSLGKKP